MKLEVGMKIRLTKQLPGYTTIGTNYTITAIQGKEIFVKCEQGSTSFNLTKHVLKLNAIELV